MLHAALPSHSSKPPAWGYVQSRTVFKTAALGHYASPPGCTDAREPASMPLVVQPAVPREPCGAPSGPLQAARWCANHATEALDPRSPGVSMRALPLPGGTR